MADESDTWEEYSDESKRRCVHFSVSDKLKYIERMDQGETANSIAEEVGLSPATVRRWRHYKREFEKFDDMDNRKRLRMGANPSLDDAIFDWYEERKSQGIKVSDASLKVRAWELNEKMSNDNCFNASNGWLRRWKARYGIGRDPGDNDCGATDVSVDETIMAPFTFEERFSQTLQCQMELTSSQIFNVTVTTLCYKSLPIKRLERTGRGSWNMNQDRVSLMICSNADATLKLRPLVVGKSAQPRGLKNVQKLAIPVSYDHDDFSAVTTRIFGDWFVNEFVPTVNEFLSDKKMPMRAVLLLDDTDPKSPDLSIGGIKTMLMPPDEEFTVRTLKHKVTEDLKRRYRQRLLQSASDAQDKGHDPLQHVKILGMKDIVFRLDDAWTEVTRQTIVTSWNNFVVPIVEPESDPLAIGDQPEENVILNLLRKIGGKNKVLEQDIYNWIIDNEPLPRIPLMDNEELLAAHYSNQRSDKNDEEPIDDIISPGEAVEALDSVIKFFERHARLSPVELAALRKAREQAESTTRKQRSKK